MRLLKYILLLAAALTAIAGLIFTIEGPLSGTIKDAVSRLARLSPSGAANQSGPVGLVASGPAAPELGGIAAWINSEPLSLLELRGKVVLLDFWTYSCVNCIRTFPSLKLWHAKYADDGLVILGVHTPEFDFEKNLENVTQAARDHEITWPVALDNEYVTWDNYDNVYWPAKYLIDQDGVVRHTYFGEGGYATMERKIRELLVEAGADLSSDELPSPPDHVLDPDFFLRPGSEFTPELYAGYERGLFQEKHGADGYVGQTEYYRGKDSVVELVAPEVLTPNQIYFNGAWFSGPESARHARTRPTMRTTLP